MRYPDLEVWRTSPVAEAVARGASRGEVEQLLRDRFEQGLARFEWLTFDSALCEHAAGVLSALPFTMSDGPDVDGLLHAMFRSWAKDHFNRGIGKGSEQLYESVRLLEERPLYGALVEEEWAADLAFVMAASGWQLQKACLSSPVRMTMMCGVLEQALSQGQSFGQRSTLFDQLLARIRTIREEVAPFARATLIEWAHSSSEKTAHDAVVVLLLIGTAGDLQRVPPIEKLRAPLGKVLSEEEVRRVGLLTSLRYLDLPGLTRDNVGGLYALRSLPLETLSLSGGHIYDSDLAIFLQNTTLWSLNLSNTLVNDGAIPYLLRWNLEILDVAGSRVTNEGVRTLREHFPLATIHT
jgi:hypothetical protein